MAIHHLHRGISVTQYQAHGAECFCTHWYGGENGLVLVNGHLDIYCCGGLSQTWCAEFDRLTIASGKDKADLANKLRSLSKRAKFKKIRPSIAVAIKWLLKPEKKPDIVTTLVWKDAKDTPPPKNGRRYYVWIECEKQIKLVNQPSAYHAVGFWNKRPDGRWGGSALTVGAAGTFFTPTLWAQYDPTPFKKVSK
jgi:hypothetical protein